MKRNLTRTLQDAMDDRQPGDKQAKNNMSDEEQDWSFDDDLVFDFFLGEDTPTPQ